MYDIAIIGMGPAGLEVARVAIKNNLKVIAFEEEKLGGTCLNKGCVPTKAILHCANLLDEIRNSDSVGINCENIKFDWQKIIERKNNIVSKFNKALDLSLSKKIEIIKGKAELIKDNDKVSIKCNGNFYEAKYIIIATGSTPVELKGLEFNHTNIISSDDILELEKLPQSITIVGSGAIGLEIASFLKSFGVDITIIEKAQNLAPNLDIDLQKRIERILKTKKINFIKDDFIINYNNKTITLNSTKTLSSEKILVAVGRKPNLPNIIDLKGNIINLKINDDYSCNIKNLYVIGDTTGKTMLAHSASNQARELINRLVNNTSAKNINIPAVVYITPEIATTGLKEQDIIDKSDYIIKKVMLGSLAKSWCEEASDGMAKVIIKDNKIVGAHLVGKNASILISIFNILIEKEIPINKIENFIFPHPCYSEIIQEVLRNE